MSASRFKRFSSVVLAANLLVILWGAFVRATGSGAGCGDHWPTCNGQVIPRAPSVATLIEYTHRATSGIALLLVFALVVAALRLFARGHWARRAAIASGVLILTEALVGAGLVLFKMVAHNDSIARGAWTIVHLGNTFALVGALTMTRWAAGLPPGPAAKAAGGRGPSGHAPWLVVGMIGVLFVAMTGAVAALGDTLFPVGSLAEGWRQDFSDGAHLFVRLRVLHPLLAAGVALYLLIVAGVIAAAGGSRELTRTATLLAALVFLQVVVGLTNLVLLAPTWLQLVHLLLADLVWIALVVLTAEAAGLRARAAERAAGLAGVGLA